MPELLLLSFHGMPERTLHLGDPYHCHCRKTARLLTERFAASHPALRVATSFQSRFGRAKWLEPATDTVLVEEARKGTRRVAIAATGFSADCLETLEEIAQEARDAFMDAGGKAFHYIPCLNADPSWIEALADVSEQHLAGWATMQGPDLQALARSRDEALALGATR